MLDLYCIEDTSNLCESELNGREYNTSDTWSTFQEDFIKFKNMLITNVSEKKPTTIIRVFDGEFFFLRGQKVGNVESRHCMSNLTYEFIQRFYYGALACDYISTQLYTHEVAVYKEIFPSHPMDFPMEFIYAIVANRWIFKTFKNRISLIGGSEKMKIIRKLMDYPEYREYLGLDFFLDYIEVPERHTCDNIDSILADITPKIAQSKADIFLFGMGIGKLAITHHLKDVKHAVYLDIGCGISAMAGTTSLERPYFGSWTNFRLKDYDYSSMDPIDYKDTKGRNERIL
jgi:hypothetical protein